MKNSGILVLVGCPETQKKHQFQRRWDRIDIKVQTLQQLRKTANQRHISPPIFFSKVGQKCQKFEKSNFETFKKNIDDLGFDKACSQLNKNCFEQRLVFSKLIYACLEETVQFFNRKQIYELNVFREFWAKKFRLVLSKMHMSRRTIWE